MEDWKQVEGFHRYSVSRLGDVRNDLTGRIMHLSVNQYGVVFVGLMKREKQHKRSVALLVAQAFLDEPPTDFYDTPINLDGDRHNNRVDNLAWRPRWFAVKYNQQFKTPYHNRIETLLCDKDSGQEYIDSFQAAIKNGLLEKDVVLGILNRTPIWPTYQVFEVVLD